MSLVFDHNNNKSNLKQIKEAQMVTIALRLMSFKSQGYAMSARLFLALLACPDDFSLFIYWRARQSLFRGLDLSPHSSMIP